MIYRVDASGEDHNHGQESVTYCLTKKEAIEWAKTRISEDDAELVSVYAAKTPRTKQAMTCTFNGYGWRRILSLP